MTHESKRILTQSLALNQVSFCTSFFFWTILWFTTPVTFTLGAITPASSRPVKSHHSLCSPTVRFVWAGANEVAAVWMRTRSGPNKRTDTSLKRWSWYAFKRTVEAFACCENAIRPPSDPTAGEKKTVHFFGQNQLL